jgi:uncharacterized membrane protein
MMSNATVVFAGWVLAGLAGCLGLASEFRKKGGVINYSATDLVVMMVLIMFGPVSLAAYMLIKLEV